MRSSTFAIIGIAAFAAVAFAFADEGMISFPDGYRAWTFLHSSLVPAGFPAFSKSPCVKPCTNGIFHFYANEAAMKGLRTGTYADGAMIAEEMLEFLVGEKGNGGEGRRVLTAVMVKDSQRYAATGGWGFGNFNEGSKVNTLDTKAQQECYQCHTSRKDRGYVFTQYTERSPFQPKGILSAGQSQRRAESGSTAAARCAGLKLAASDAAAISIMAPR